MDEHMRAIGFRRFGGPDVVEHLRLPVPVPGPGQVRVAVRAAGLNPTDVKVPAGVLDGVVPHRFPVVLGWDAAGVVDAVGEDAGWVPGEEVVAFTRSTPVAAGALADYVVLDAAVVARKPRRLDFPAAAVLPLAGLMADQLVEALGDAGRGRVLVLGAAGGVGTLVTQLLAARDAEVLGSDRADRHDRMRRHGVALALDAFRPLGPQVAAGGTAEIDAIVDLVGGGALAAAAPLLRGGGPVASSMQPPQAVLGPDAVGSFVVVEPDGRRLARLVDLVDRGLLAVPPTAVVGFDEALAAIDALRTGTAAVKTAVVVR
jgi:NADPH:quinone reductase-like Zn-dependent oxidoreductase